VSKYLDDVAHIHAKARTQASPSSIYILHWVKLSGNDIACIGNYLRNKHLKTRFSITVLITFTTNDVD